MPINYLSLWGYLLMYWVIIALHKGLVLNKCQSIISLYEGICWCTGSSLLYIKAWSWINANQLSLYEGICWCTGSSLLYIKAWSWINVNQLSLSMRVYTLKQYITICFDWSFDINSRFFQHLFLIFELSSYDDSWYDSFHCINWTLTTTHTSLTHATKTPHTNTP